METLERRGRLITIEGVEGAGKTTVAAFLRDSLAKETGREVILTAEPGGEPVANRIRKIVLDSSAPISSKTELFLILASRAQLVSAVIQPALENGTWVISDRFTDSTLAYQGFGRGFDVKWLRGLNDFAAGGLRPDLTILLDVPVEVGLARQGIRDRIGGEALAFHQKVREGFLAIASEESERTVVLDATSELAEVLNRALSACGRLFTPRRANP